MLCNVIVWSLCVYCVRQRYNLFFVDLVNQYITILTF